jgi:hypothetical protein
LVREEESTPSLIAGFNIRELRHQSKLLFTSPIPLEEIQCKWTGATLDLITPEQFVRVRIWAPEVSSVTLNGVKTLHKREGEYILVGQSTHLAMTVSSSNDSILFLGRKNAVVVRVWNPTEETVEGAVRINLATDWKERSHSQLTWWGGIVNLLATNKGPIERTVFPTEYTQDASWIEGLSSASKRIPPGGMETFTLEVEVPNDAGPVRYPTFVSFGTDTVQKPLVVRAPVQARMIFPNAHKDLLRVDLANRTPEQVTVTATLALDSAWGTTDPLQQTVSLGPLETKRLDRSVRLRGYLEDNQLYPIRLRVEHEEYSEDIEHDFYVGVAHYAPSPPALDGSWRGWERSNPMRINKASQIGRLLFGNQPWEGEGDLSASVSVMYDDAYLYVGAAVRDDSLVTHWDFPRMSYPWDTDCMEVVLDTRVNSSQGFDPPTPGSYRHLSMAEHRVTDFSAEMWQGAGAGGPLLPKPNLIPGAETYFQRTDDGYSIVAKYPLSSLGDIVAEPGYKIGFDVAINDNDGTNYRKNQHIWAGYNQNQSWWDTGSIGALVFGPKEN